jgi:hypothetical protein
VEDGRVRGAEGGDASLDDPLEGGARDGPAIRISQAGRVLDPGEDRLACYRLGRLSEFGGGRRVVEVVGQRPTGRRCDGMVVAEVVFGVGQHLAPQRDRLICAVTALLDGREVEPCLQGVGVRRPKDAPVPFHDPTGHLRCLLVGADG